jgi:hypothetical protein
MCSKVDHGISEVGRFCRVILYLPERALDRLLKSPPLITSYAQAPKEACLSWVHLNCFIARPHAVILEVHRSVFLCLVTGECSCMSNKIATRKHDEHWHGHG